MTEMQSPTKKSKLPLIIGVLIAILGLSAAGVFAYRNIKTASQASAEAMPPTTLAYLSLDIINLFEPTTLRRFSDAFETQLEDADITTGSPEDARSNFNEGLEEFGMNFEEDIQPWVGRSIGMGVLTLSEDIASSPDGSAVIAVEIRDTKEADAFLERFSAENETTAAIYNKVDYMIENAVSSGELILGRSGSLMLVASDVTSFEQAVDAQAGDSLATLVEYKEIVAMLSESRTITAIIPQHGLETFIDLAKEQADSDLLATSYFEEMGLGSQRAVALTLDITGNGFEVDFASLFDPEKTSDFQKTLLENFSTFEGAQTNNLPETSMIYVGSFGIGHLWELGKQAMIASGSAEDFEDAMTLAEETLGFSIENDLMPQLTGELAIAIVEDSQSAIAQQSGVNLGFVIHNGVNDSAEMSRLNDLLSNTLEEQGMILTEEAGIVSVEVFETPIASYGVFNNNFSIATNSQLIAGQGSGSTTLDDNLLFKRAKSILPDDMKLLGFVDTQALVDLVAAVATTEEDIANLAEMTDIAGKIPIFTYGIKSEAASSLTRLVFVITE